jgi:hypothetical protein
VEDNSAQSPAHTAVDAEIGFRQGKQWRAAVDIFNIGASRPATYPSRTVPISVLGLS